MSKYISILAGLALLLVSCQNWGNTGLPDDFSEKLLTLHPFDTSYQIKAYRNEHFPEVEADIRILVNLDAQLKNYQGHQSIFLKNRTIHPWESVGFYLYPNFVKGKLDVTEVKLGGKRIEYKIKNAVLTVNFPVPLMPGSILKLDLLFAGSLPEACFGSAALSSNGDTFFMGGFYPEIIPHQENGSWRTIDPQIHGDPPENPLAIYSVVLTAPKGLEIASSGLLQKSKIDGNQQEYLMVSGPVRDFIVAGSFKWNKISIEKKGITVNSFYPEKSVLQAVKGAYTALDALSIFSKKFGNYPYYEIDLVGQKFESRRLGMEYPGVLVVLDGAYDPDGKHWGYSTDFMMEFVTAEETAHQWFYNMVGNNTFEEPWIDETFTHYAIWLYYNSKYGKSKGNWIYSFFENRWRRIGRKKIPLNTPSDQLSPTNYYSIIQGRAVLFLFDMELKFGQQSFDKFLESYIKEYQWKSITSEKLNQLVTRSFGEAGNKMYREWVYGEKIK